MTGSFKTTPVVSPLRKALTGPRRVGRQAAIAQASQNVETLRTQSTETLLELVQQMATSIGTPARHLPEEAMQEVAATASAIFNLAGTFGYPVLQNTVARLYDLLAAMLKRGLYCKEPVAVIIGAAQLAAPGMPPLSEEEREQLLTHLDRILAKYRTRPELCDQACQVCPAAAVCGP